MAARRRAGSFSPKTSRRLRISKMDMLDMACLLSESSAACETSWMYSSFNTLRRNSDSRLCRLSRAIGLCFGEENAIESRAELPVNHEPENRYHETRHNPARIHQRMEKQNIDNYWPSDCQCQWNGSSKEKQHSRDQLKSKYKHQVVRRKHDREILTGHLRWPPRPPDKIHTT